MEEASPPDEAARESAPDEVAAEAEEPALGERRRPPRGDPRARPRRLPAYQVAARLLLQGGISGVAGAVPLTLFLILAMALEGRRLPDPLSFVGGYLFFAAMISAWGAALTLVEEFARLADRSVGRMVAVSLGFPLFATLVTAYIGGVVDGGPVGGLRMARMIVRDLWREFQREPIASLAITSAFLIPFLGLLLLRRYHREEEGEFLVSGYYMSCGGLGLASAACVLLANLLWGTRIDGGPVLLGFVALAVLVMAVAWGMARGRAISDRYSRRYEAWADAD